MRLMRGASVESGVVRVLFGVGERRVRKGKIKSKVKGPTLNRQNRDLEWGTLGSLDPLGGSDILCKTFTGGARPVSPRSTSTPKATANSTATSTAADRSVRGTQAQVTYKRLGERAEAAFLA